MMQEDVQRMVETTTMIYDVYEELHKRDKAHPKELAILQDKQ